MATSYYVDDEDFGFDGVEDEETEYVDCKRCRGIGSDHQGADCIPCFGLGAIPLR